ncbi:hypothetical protein OIU78_008475 [Salix suchowensis]|nr:hypothetical protein OIU78_008475 [Salix suchowensis]
MPNLPDDITLTRNELPRPERHDDEPDFSKMYKQVKEGDLKSYGVVVNSFYELEPAYADHYRKAFGRKAWHILKIGIRIGVQEQALSGGDSIKSEALEKAVSQLMEGEEAEEMRSRAAAYGKMARKAVEEGGSSYSDLNALIDELSFCRQG